MNEEQVKKRGWVKNAAIIFLSVMLVLTFFSNTFMNRSLPEVASQYTQSGTINAKIRGTGAVAANQSYQVSLQESRQIQSVNVKLGDKVEVGDVLFVLADVQSQELTDAEKSLDDMTLAYQKALLNAANTDYTKQNRAIQSIRTQLAAAIQSRDSLRVTDAQLQNAKNAAANAQTTVNTLKYQLSQLGGGAEGGSAALTQKQNELTSAQSTLNAMMASAVGANYNTLAAAAAAECGSNNPSVYGPYMADISNRYATSTNTAEYDQYLAYKAVTDAQNTVAKLQQEVASLQNAAQYESVSRQLSQATMDLDSANAALTALQTQKTGYDAAVEKAATLENSLEDALADLKVTQNTDKNNSAISSLELANMRKQISRQQETVNKYVTNAVGKEVTAAAAGVISALNVSAGNTTTSGQALATIDVVDRGYTVKIPVTNEQSKKVQIGDTAEITNYWQSDITAVLQSITSDPANPGKGKLLVFQLTGDLEPGVNLGVSIGQKSATYDTLVPNSAIRSDSNGDFVLTVTVKNSPLGNRYVATRTDVKVLASDDVNTAVSGLSSGDYVITTSSRPLESGMLVRLADNG